MRKFVYVIVATVAVICIYLGWTFYSRNKEQREYFQGLAEKKAKENRAVKDAYGGDSLTILGFYVTPGAVIQKGETVQICYGVNAMAKSVSIEPPIGDVWPALSRCIDITPKKDTTYNLIAEDESGNKKTASLTIQVK